MTRRVRWLALGAALGAGGAVWSQRRLAELADRAKEGKVPADVVRLVDRGSKRLGRHVASSMAVGRAEARRRELELRQSVERRPLRPFAG